jgi:phosphoribosyl-ATP pyrophosphohydrolase
MLRELFEIILNRKSNPTPDSYTVQLLSDGEDRILQKVGEEAVEVILASKGQGDRRLIEEMADLFYHSLVLLAFHDLKFSEIEDELRRRHQQFPTSSS